MPPVNTRTDRAAATTAAFLDATIACLVERGIAGTTTVEISRRAGVSPGLFVRYWPTKAALLAAAAEYAQRRSLATFEERWAASTTGSDDNARIRAAIRVVIELHGEPEMRCLVDLEAAARTNPELADALRGATTAIDQLLTRSARRLAPGGVLSDRFDAAARLVVDCARGVAQRTAFLPGPDAAAARRAAADDLAELLGVPPTPR